MDSPKTFAAKMQSLLGISPYWSGNSAREYTAPKFSDPAVSPVVVGKSPATSGGVKGQGFAGALKRALKFADSSLSTLTPGGAMAHAAKPVAEGGTKALRAAGNAASSAASGIRDGFRWVVVIFCLGLAFYVFAVLSPFLPKAPR